MRLRVVCAALLVVAAGSAHAQTDDADVRVLRAACQALTPNQRGACGDALARLTAKKLPAEAASQPQIAKELITLRGLAFDSGNVKDALWEMCVTPATARREDLRKSTIWCRFDKNGEISMPGFEYGGLSDHLSSATVDEGGALVKFWTRADTPALLQLASVLEDKYGRPSISTEQVRNKMGTKFDKKTFTWIDARGTRIVLDSLYDRVDEGRITIVSASYQRAVEMLEKAKRENSKGKL